MFSFFQQENKMERFEYREVRSVSSPRHREEWLNMQGNAGWELCAATPDKRSLDEFDDAQILEAWRFFFKRTLTT